MSAPQAADSNQQQQSLVSTDNAITAPAEDIQAQAEEVFKVPALPVASSSSSFSAGAGDASLPADISQILALGAHIGDDYPTTLTGEPRPSTSNYEEVVRDLKAKAGFASEAKAEEEGDGDGDVAKGDALEAIEREMAQGGVTREEGELVEEEGMEGMDVAAAKQGAPAVEPSDDDSSSSDSSESDTESDSDDDAAVATALSARAAPTNATSKPNNRRNRRNRAPSAGGSDLSDDDVNTSSTPHGGPKTEHEVEPEVIVPSLSRMPEGVELAAFGKVESVIDTVVVIRADTDGNWRVIDEGTVVCWDDGLVAGTIFETFGAVSSPMYTLRFAQSNAPDPGTFALGRKVFYAPKLASFVFTRDIRALKGSDASNLYDEEVEGREMEFSDDEAEQEYKRAQKAERKARGPASRAGSVAPSNGRGKSVTPAPSGSALPSRPVVSYNDEDGGAYTPLARPRDLHLLLERTAQPKADVGELPPSGADGRRMFERARGSYGEGDEAEVEFSDEEPEGAEGGREAWAAAMREEQQRAAAPARGGARGGRGAARGHGGAQTGGRQVAALPSRPTAGLPQRPAFEAGAEGAAAAPSGAFTFGAPQQTTSPPTQHQQYPGYPAQGFNPMYPGAGGYPAFPPQGGFHPGFYGQQPPAGAQGYPPQFGQQQAVDAQGWPVYPGQMQQQQPFGWFGTPQGGFAGQGAQGPWGAWGAGQQGGGGGQGQGR